MKWFANMKSEKGAAAVLVLSVIMVLSALGTIALVASVANIRMSDKSRVWTKAYYTLDKKAEEQVQAIDILLKNAEEASRKYVQGNCSSTSAVVAADMSQEAQNFFYENRYSLLYPKTLDDFLNDTLHYPDPADAEAAYTTYRKDAISIYDKDLLERTYFYYASKYLATLASVSPVIINIDNQFPNLDSYSSDAASVNHSTWSGTEAAIKPTSDKYIQINFTVQADPLDLNYNANDKKKVEVVLDVIPSLYKVSIQAQNMPYQGNPIYTYALTAQGTISVSSAGMSIYGDVYSSVTAPSVVAGSGLAVTTNSAVDIYGNVYTAGDVHVTGNNGKLRVHRAPVPASPYARDLKNEVYYKQGGLDGTLLFDVEQAKSKVSPSVAAVFGSYFEGTAVSVPLVYFDNSNYGNVYCRSLSIENSVTTGGTIAVMGSVLAIDDIQMDGLYSTITLGDPAVMDTGNFIGLCSEADNLTHNPNNSSSVINNQPFDADGNPVSKINLYGKNIIPGTAFVEFNAANNSYYQSAESATARLPEIFNTYISTTSGTGIEFETPDGDKYYMKNYPTLADKLTGFLTDLGLLGGVKTNIFNGSDSYTGYSLGAAVIQKDDENIAKAYTSANIINYADNQLAFNNMYLALKEIFKEKTEQLGTRYPSAFAYYVDNTPTLTGKLNGNGIYYYNGVGNHTLDISSIQSGIIYSEGNLAITATGTNKEFNGAIICEGNIDINDDNIRINYDEGVIKGILSNNRFARDFFKPIMGNPVAWTTDFAVGSATRNELKRVIVREWKEKQDG